MKKLFLISFFCLASTAISFAQLKVLSTGNVGIGNNLPYALLHIKSTGTTYAKMFQLTNATTGSNNGDGLIIRSGSGGNDFEIINQENGYLNFYTNNSEKMRIESDGDVCIGTTASANQGKLYIYNTNGNAGLRVNKYYTGGAYNIVSQVSDTSCKSIVSQFGGADKFCVWGNGKTNIGFSNLTPWMLAVNGNAYSWGLWLGSDVNFKQNITDIDTPMDKLNQISGKKYQFNSAAFPQMNFPKGYTYGVIAQEIQAVLPELVMADSAGYLAVNYNGLIPILIEAVKLQQLTIKTQEERINTIENDLVNCCNIKSTEKMMNQTQGSNNTNNNSTTATLYQNVPNPFKIKTTIRYYLPNESNVASMLIFDMQGKLIKTYNINTAGDGNIEINAGELQPGMYMYSLIANGKEVDTKKMILTE
jgi:hypothetical protein